MIDASQLRLAVIRPVLKEAGVWSQAAENLVLGTAAQESCCGKYLVQLKGGPARGIFQMEPRTLDDIYDNYLSYRDDLRGTVDAWLIGAIDKAENLTVNLAYAALMCRVHYLRRAEPLPKADDVRGMAVYWKRYYNTVHGKGTEQEFVENYERYIGGA
ncbi:MULTISPECIES: hypothetical protein [unclassified Thalassospira]|uniref:hypothetical protein n=1 Tax=unclassified Thalassospira TaxID=2648997 RepID=UPI0007A56E5B|nr:MULTISPECIES: hypothetical protein [unclassified Thalassospira]KZC99678.1 hypothetical protein AUQ41_08340 [Thalassospira sp. MCCC 1A02898]ONH85283.1 hypothetical protein TH47_06315 [Thalassospira sp. MCCC 1A02803]